jgi:hypothetical protein
MGVSLLGISYTDIRSQSAIRWRSLSDAAGLSKIGAFTMLALLIAAIGCGGGTSQQPPPPPSNGVIFSPSSGAVGTVVTITGADFSATQSASIGNVPALIVSQSSSSLAAIVMPGAASGSVSVMTSGGTFDGNGMFTVTPTGIPRTQQGGKLTGSGNTGESQQGYSVALSADGNTAALGGVNDNSSAGAVWVFVRSGNTWTQQGNKLVGSGAVGAAVQGFSVAKRGW